jgi:hypothetical protein
MMKARIFSFLLLTFITKNRYISPSFLLNFVSSPRRVILMSLAILKA